MSAQPRAQKGAAYPPDEKITLRKAASALGLSKRALQDYTRYEDDPLPFTTGEDNGYKYVTMADCLAFLSRHPECGKSARRPVDRQPSGEHAPGKTYMTIAEAAGASGYTQSGIRSMIKAPENPLPAERNEEGWYLIDADVFWDYIEKRGAAMDPSEPPTADLSMYPELAALEGTYHSMPKIASALGIPTSMIAAWQADPVNPLPYLTNGKRTYINKYRLPAYIESREAGKPKEPRNQEWKEPRSAQRRERMW